MAALLFHHWPKVAEAMQWCDVDIKPQWQADFGLKVPVIQLNGETISEYFLNKDLMQQHFGEPSNPV